MWTFFSAALSFTGCSFRMFWRRFVALVPALSVLGAQLRDAEKTFRTVRYAGRKIKWSCSYNLDQPKFWELPRTSFRKLRWRSSASPESLGSEPLISSVSLGRLWKSSLWNPIERLLGPPGQEPIASDHVLVFSTWSQMCWDTQKSHPEFR